MTAMTNDPLMDQCRKEAEERYPKPLSTAEAMRDSWNEHIAKFEREAYAAALYSVATGKIRNIGDVSISLGRYDPTS